IEEGDIGWLVIELIGMPCGENAGSRCVHCVCSLDDTRATVFGDERVDEASIDFLVFFDDGCWIFLTKKEEFCAFAGRAYPCRLYARARHIEFCSERVYSTRIAPLCDGSEENESK